MNQTPEYIEAYKNAYAEAMADIIDILHDIHDTTGPEELHRHAVTQARCDASHDILTSAYGLVGINAVRTEVHL